MENETYRISLKELLKWMKHLKGNLEDVGYYYSYDNHDIEYLEYVVNILEELDNKEVVSYEKDVNII